MLSDGVASLVMAADGEHSLRVPTDDELWTGTHTGDADAFGSLFERHAKAIFNYCYRQTGDATLAEDLTSVVFLEVWRRRSKTLESGMVRAWLFGVATNVLRNRKRAERRHAAALRRLPREAEAERFEDQIDETVDESREAERALTALAGLPRRERDVFVLCAWSELSYDETALALGIPIGTVRSRLSRARKRLVRELTSPTGHENTESAIADSKERTS